MQTAPSQQGHSRNGGILWNTEVIEVEYVTRQLRITSGFPSFSTFYKIAHKIEISDLELKLSMMKTFAFWCPPLWSNSCR